MSKKPDLTPSDKTFYQLMEDMIRQSLADPHYVPQPINCRCAIVEIKPEDRKPK